MHRECILASIGLRYRLANSLTQDRALLTPKKAVENLPLNQITENGNIPGRLKQIE